MFTRLKTTVAALALLLLLTTPGWAREESRGLSPRLADALEKNDSTAVSADGTIAVWVRFVDKGLTDFELETALADLEKGLSEKTISRRQAKSLSGQVVDGADLPVAPQYVAEVGDTGAVLRRQSRWLNAASYNATADQIAVIARLPFVASVDLVARGVGQRPPLEPEASPELQALMSGTGKEKSFGTLDYGTSGPGLTQMNIPAVHDMGLSGRGVTVAVLDTGFELEHESLRDLDVVATWDFVNDSSYVGPRKEEDPGQVLYGTAALSILAGFSRSTLIGSAYNASVILAKTEDLASETPVEEDNWIAALEWAEGLGADVVSSGLGYYSWYTFADLDGYTAAITVAAEMASARGVCVVSSNGDFRGSSTWPYLLPPADGRSVIAVGSVDLNNQVTWFSSSGPTADGRTKPDVMAFCNGHPAAAAWANDLYNFGYGGNYSVPLVSGIVALMLEHNRSLSPHQVMEALHMTGNRAAAPDNDFGWGIADALAAVNYWVPTISHTPLKDSEGGTGSHKVVAMITGPAGLDEDRLYVSYRVGAGGWQLAPMVPDGDGQYTGAIPPQGRTGQVVDYYLVATGSDGQTSNHPADSPTTFHSFCEGADTTPPVIKHLTLPDMTKAHWPPTLRAEASDNKGLNSLTVLVDVPGLGSVGPFDMVEVGDHYELEFPIPVESVFPGFTITYLIMATDTAAVPNLAVAGPHFFEVVASKGSVLLVDDRYNSKSLAAAERRGVQSAAPAEKSVADLSLWLTDAGFAVDTIMASAVKSSSFLGYDAVMVSSGSNFAPFAFPELRRTMVLWTELGGKLIVEGGETGYTTAVAPGYPEMMGTALPISAYSGEDASRLWAPVEMADFPLLKRPHILPAPILVDTAGGNDWGAADLVDRSPTSFVAMHAGYGTTRGGIIIHDNNTGVESGQIVYFPFDIIKTDEAEGRMLLDNVMTYLLTEEPPGSASISGQITLAGQSDHAGITVRVGVTHSTITAADGSYTLPGLWGGDYSLIVEEAGYAPVTRRVTVVDDMDTGGKDFYLIPVTETSYVSSPGLAIPDNDAAGVFDTVNVTEAGGIYGVTIEADISHYAIGQLVITLTSPQGTEVTLHNRSGGTVDDVTGVWPTSLFVDGPGSLNDFLGENATGAWTLKVSDHQLGALGTINNWGLNLLVKAADASSVAGTLPVATRLIGNSPNPFNPRTMIAFDLANDGPVRLEIFDLRGRRVRQLADRGLPAGSHSLLWDGRSDSGNEVASGLYFYRLTAADKQQTNKMLLVR